MSIGAKTGPALDHPRAYQSTRFLTQGNKPGEMKADVGARPPEGESPSMYARRHCHARLKAHSPRRGGLAPPDQAWMKAHGKDVRERALASKRRPHTDLDEKKNNFVASMAETLL